MIALYHRIMRRETFEKAAKDLFKLLKAVQVKTPDMERVLYVDIDVTKTHKVAMIGIYLNYRKNLELASWGNISQKSTFH